MKTRKLISALISIAMVISMLPMTLVSAEDITISQVVSVGKDAFAYNETGLRSNSANLTDGDASRSDTTCVTYINSSGAPTYIDLGETYAISKVVVNRRTYGETNGAFQIWASDDLYTTQDDVYNGTLVGSTEEVGTSTVTITPTTPVNGRYVYLKATTPQGVDEITVYADTVIKNVIEQVVSVGKTATAYTDGNTNANAGTLTDGVTSTTSGQYANWINNGSDKPVTIDLGETYYISKVDVHRVGYAVNGAGAFGVYASDNLYTTNTAVKAGAALIGTNTETSTVAETKTITPDTVVPGRYVYLTPDTAQAISEITVYAKVPRPAAAISATETTTLEAETYATEFAQAFGADSYTTVSNSWTLPTAISQYSSTVANSGVWMFAPASSGTKTMSIPVSFATSGAYSATLRLGLDKTNTELFKSYAVYLTNEDGDRVDFGKTIYPEWIHGSADYGYGTMDDVLGFTGSFASGAVDFKVSSQAYVEAGTYTLNIDFDNSQAAIIDYINFAPCAVAQVSMAGTYLQAEDYMNVETSDAYADYANDTTIAYEGWGFAGTETATYNMPINVTEAGTYDIETVMAKQAGGATSAVTIKVDGNVVYANDENGEDVSADNTFVGSYFPMYKYTAPVELTAGIHNIEIVLANATEASDESKKVYKFAIDYVKLAEAVPENSKTEADGVTTINVYYDEALTANVFAVFYNGSEVVDIARGTLTDAAATITAEITSSEYTSVKVFAWNDLMVPQDDVVNF